MKKLFTIAMMTIAAFAKGQVVLEHSYSTNYPMAVCHLEDYGDKYIGIDTGTKSVLIYNTDHSLWKTINTGIPQNANVNSTVFLSSQYLFNNDNKVEFVVSYYTTSPTVYTSKLFNEDGNLLFTFNNVWGVSIHKVGSDWKLLTNHVTNSPYSNYSDVYAVPGQWTGITYAGKSNQIQSDIYPNPMESNATINYTLPAGASQGSLNIYNDVGVLVRTYNVTNQFSELFISKDQLAPGIYIYDITTVNGRQTGQKFVVQ